MAIALVKSAKGSAATATVNPAFGSATTSGNLIVLAFGADDYNASPGAGWTQSAEMEQQSNLGGYIWWRISTGETSYSYTIGSATNSAWVIAEYSGVDATPYDISEGQFATSAGSTYTTPNITPTTGNRVLVAMIAGSTSSSLSAASVGTWLNSFTAIDSQGSGGAGTNDLVGLAYRLVTGDGSTTFSTGGTYSVGGAIQARIGLIISFKEAVSAGSPYTLTADTGTLTLTGQTAELHGPWRLVGVGTSVQVTATGHTLTLPAGVQQDDLLIAVISSRIASTTSITLPTGGEWQLIAEQKTNNVLTTTSAVASGMMAYCIRGASDPNLVFTHPTAPSVALGRIVVYRGGYVGGFMDQSNSATTAINTTSVSVAGVTTAYPGDLIVVGLCGGQEAAWSAVDATNPSVASGATDTTTHPTYNTWIERADVTTTTGSDTSLGIADAVKTAAGATGNITATASSAASHVVLIGAFRPAVVSGAPYTLTADQGSFALSGQTAVLRRGRALIAAQASFQVNGQATGLKRGKVLIATTNGAFALTGQTAALRAIRTMPAAQGAFALNGQTAGLRRGKVLIATTAGAFTLTGQTAALKRTYVMPAAQAAFTVSGTSINLVYSGAGSKTMVASPGMFALTGQTTGLLATRRMSGGQGAFALTGQTVFLRQSNLPLVAAQGSFALSGQTAVLRRGLKVTATFGTFTLTGQAVVLGVALPAATATFTLTGQIAATRIARKLVATLGSFTVSGQAVTFKRTRVMPTTFGSFAVTGQAVVLNYSGEGDIDMPVTAGFFVLTGQTATLRVTHKLVAGQGAFLLTGQTVALNRSRIMPVAQGMFNAAGQAATLTVTHVSDRVLVAATGSFVLTGNVVSLDVWRVTPLEVQPGRLTFGRKVSIRRW